MVTTSHASLFALESSIRNLSEFPFSLPSPTNLQRASKLSPPTPALKSRDPHWRWATFKRSPSPWRPLDDSNPSSTCRCPQCLDSSIDLARSSAGFAGLAGCAKVEREAHQGTTIQAAAQPDPMLRYRLWPEPELRKDENAAPLVSRAVILELQVSAETQKQFNERFQEWNEMSIDELPVDEVRALVGKYVAALGELQRSRELDANRLLTPARRTHSSRVNPNAPSRASGNENACQSAQPARSIGDS